MSNTITDQKTTSKKFKAVLAGGVVLGVGAAVTLAAWTDQQWATADFSSGSFTLESSTSNVQGKGFERHSTPSALDFEMPQVDQLGPNEQVAAPFSIRLDDDTTHDADVSMAAGVTGQTAGLSYEAIHVDSPEQCSTALSTGSGTALGDTPAAMPKIELSAGKGEKAGSPYSLCFIVSASDDLPQNQSASANWQFVAESVAE